MSVFYRFLPQDILLSVVHAKPRVAVVSGSNGWRGTVGASASVSLYGGFRSRTVPGLSVTPIIVDGTWTLEQTRWISGSYPATGTIELVKVRFTEAPSEDAITSTQWYAEHANPILGLYDYYGLYRANYSTASYDYHSLFFKDDAARTGNDTYVLFSASLPQMLQLSSSYTIEAWVKPLTVTSSVKDFTIALHYERSASLFSTARTTFYITGSTGRLALSASDGSGVIRTSSLAVTPGVWQHVAVTVGNGVGTFKINNVSCGTFAATGSIQLDGTDVFEFGIGAGVDVDTYAPPPSNGFVGYLYDVRLWNKLRTDAEMSGSYARTLAESASLGNLVVYARLNDGPLGVAHGFTRGSGAFNYAPGATEHGVFTNFNLYKIPSWQPNDNQLFTTLKTSVTDSPPLFKVFHVPQMFYGKEIATGSVRIEDRAYDALNGMQRVIVDDGRGTLYLSGSTTRQISGEEYRGVAWNRVGNVFYSEGLIVITHPALLDLGEQMSCGLSSSCVGLSFRGSNRIPTKVFNCRLGSAQGNASNNPQFVSYDSGSGKFFTNSDHSVTYATAVGLYNEEYKLVAVAKIAQPIRKREKDRLTCRVKMDF